MKKILMSVVAVSVAAWSLAVSGEVGASSGACPGGACEFNAAAKAARFHMRSIAHRGLHGPGIAQNSVEGFTAAWANGVKWIETDFHLLKDGRVLCVHDRGELKRISGEDRVIADLTAAEVAKIDIGKFAKTERPVRMPYIEDVLATVPKDCIAQCEIKLYGDTYADTFDAARRAAGLSETNILVTSFNADWLKDFKRRYPKYQTGWLGAKVSSKKQAKPGANTVNVPQIVEIAKDAGVDIVCPGAVSAMKAGLSPKDADAIRAAGFDFRLYGVNSPKALAYALKVKATAFTCDHWKDSFEWAKSIPGLNLTP